MATDQRIRLKNSSSVVPVDDGINDRDETTIGQRRQSILEVLEDHDNENESNDEESAYTRFKEFSVVDVSVTNDTNITRIGISRMNSTIATTRVTSKSEESVLVKEVLDRKVFTQTKMFVLWFQVSLMFLILLITELAMSMYLYHRDGVPANWCKPFSFDVFANGIQTVFDYFL